MNPVIVWFRTRPPARAGTRRERRRGQQRRPGSPVHQHRHPPPARAGPRGRQHHRPPQDPELAHREHPARPGTTRPWHPSASPARPRARRRFAWAPATRTAARASSCWQLHSRGGPACQSSASTLAWPGVRRHARRPPVASTAPLQQPVPVSGRGVLQVTTIYPL